MLQPWVGGLVFFGGKKLESICGSLKSNRCCMALTFRGMGFRCLSSVQASDTRALQQNNEIQGKALAASPILMQSKDSRGKVMTLHVSPILIIRGNRPKASPVSQQYSIKQVPLLKLVDCLHCTTLPGVCQGSNNHKYPIKRVLLKFPKAILVL